MQLTAAIFTRVSINGSQTDKRLSLYILSLLLLFFLNIGFSVLRRGGGGGGALIWWVATKSWQVVAVFSKWFGFGAFNERISATLNISGKMKIFSLFK